MFSLFLNVFILHTTFQIESFDEGIPAERQEYQNFLRREAKGVTYLTYQMGYRHGRPLDISLDEDRSNRNYRPIYR